MTENRGKGVVRPAGGAAAAEEPREDRVLPFSVAEIRGDEAED